LSLLVPPQTVWTEQSRPLLVHSRYWASMLYRCPDQTIDVLHRLNCAR
jgi:hypothetical protein